MFIARTVPPQISLGSGRNLTNMEFSVIIQQQNICVLQSEHQILIDTNSDTDILFNRQRRCSWVGELNIPSFPRNVS